MVSFTIIVLVVIIQFINAQVATDKKSAKSAGNQSQLTYEFSFMLLPRDRQCFYEHIDSGSKLEFSYKVLTASTMLSTNAISVEVRHLQQKAIFRERSESEGEMPIYDVESSGEYEFCFNNYHGRFLEKKVATYICITNDQSDMQSIESNVAVNGTGEIYETMTEQIWNIRGTIFHVVHSLHFKRRFENMEFAVLKQKLSFIDRCSTMMIVIILAVVFAQTYALRRLFRDKLTTATQNPRA